MVFVFLGANIGVNTPKQKTDSACRKTKQEQGMKNVKNDKVCGEKN